MISQEFPMSSLHTGDRRSLLEEPRFDHAPTGQALSQSSLHHRMDGRQRDCIGRRATIIPHCHLLKRVVAETDDSLFRATCPIQGARHRPLALRSRYALRATTMTKNMTDTGMRREQHKMMRYGEFGCHSLAHLEVWQREIAPGGSLASG